MMFGPNITGKSDGVRVFQADAGTGAFGEYEVSKGAQGDGYTNNVNALSFQASSSDATFGNSSTVQPSSLRLLPCIKL